MTRCQLRRLVKVHGYRFAKSNWRKDSIDNLGGYQLIEVARNIVIDGSRFDMNLGDVERRLTALTQ